MAETEDETFWKSMIKRLWIFFVIIAITAVAFIIGLIAVLYFHMNSWMVTSGIITFGQFSVGTLLLFLIQLILWELLLVFLPGGCFFGIAFYIWWKKLITPEEREYLKRKEEKEKESKLKKHRNSAGGGFSFIVFIAFFIVLVIQNKHLVTFENLAFIDLVTAWLLGLMWILIIFGIPCAVGGLIWYFKYKK
ncbi:MAG: hypothetical protein ACFFAT_17570 [Promethearchaeota archaeon]